MKKCNFFSVLLIALFMSLGVDSYSQNFKPIPEAIVLVSNTVDQSQSASSTPERSTFQNSQTAISNGMKVRVGQLLLAQFKNNVEVGKALEDVAAQLVVDSRRAPSKAEALSFYRNLLIL